ncbi:DNA translocase FtsK [Williamsoniiplasma lucivorax]|uniref:DNA translocase n=1 Tax=Williamsoniiplasma lucivorax TaxID=209274 RepID=A0A2S5REN0_9MOLU|nr:DNA translocase FtsK [Williamsoniiplasma lucivorax]PPE05771.1 DNA translocase [Williamsoniiplasma lucivorax]
MNNNNEKKENHLETAEEIIANHDFNDDKTVAFQTHKKKYKKDSIAWIVTGLILFFFTFFSLGRITVVGQFFDDVFFNLIFGWFKFPVYLILIILDICIYSGIRFKFKKRFLVMVAVTTSLLCLFVSLSLMTAVYDQQIAVGSPGKTYTIDSLWQKDMLAKMFGIYWEQWKDSSIFSAHYGIDKMEFFISAHGYVNLFSGGGVLGTLLAGILGYLSIPFAFILTIFGLFLNMVWIFTGDAFFFFKPKAKRKGKALRVLSLKSQKNPNAKKKKEDEQKQGHWKTLNVFDPQNTEEITDADVTIKLPSFNEETIKLRLDDMDNNIQLNDHLDANLDHLEPLSNEKQPQKEINDQTPFMFQSRRKKELPPSEQAVIDVVDNEANFHYGDLDPNEARKLFARESNLTPFGPKPVTQKVEKTHDPKVVEKNANKVVENNEIKVEEPIVDDIITEDTIDSDTAFFNHLYDEEERENECNKPYQLPPITLLNTIAEDVSNDYENKESAVLKARAIDGVFEQFKIKAKVINTIIGPTVTKFEIQPEPGTKVNSMTSLENDFKLALATQNIRIEAPIQGKNLVGIEIANAKFNMVSMREIMQSIPKTNDAKLTFVLGKNVLGKPLVAELNKMPHLLIAGSTGSGKSVMINSLIISILMRATPDEVKFLMIDPKKIELSLYSKIPHMIEPVIYDVESAIGSLAMIVHEMEVRYQKFQDASVRNIEGFNRKQMNAQDKLPFIVVIIDELADLMTNSNRKIIEESIMRIAQMARAAGIHLVLATQRPSVDVITGTIKVNIPARIAFAVTTGADSRTILDAQGAEKLIGRGDMLFMSPGTSNLLRAQGAYLSDEEIENVVHFVEQQNREN